jgi:hypothetical protein
MCLIQFQFLLAFSELAGGVFERAIVIKASLVSGHSK